MDLDKITGIQYVSCPKDSSGYAHAARDYIMALHNAGVPVTVKPVSFEKARPDYGEEDKILHGLINRKIDYNVNLIHLTPEHIPLFHEDGKFNINLSIWETTKLHPDWPPYCNGADAVLVPTEWNIGIYRDSGVTVPIGKAPHCVDFSKFERTAPDGFNIDGLSKDDFAFYTIGQWQARKNFIGLLRAYIGEFAGVRDVALVLKTYRSSTHVDEQRALLETIRNVKFNINLSEEEYPKILFIGNLLSEDEITYLHHRGDCYISLAHSEGWGLGYFEAMAQGKPTIGTAGSGNEEFMNKGNSFLVDYSLGPVYGMPYFKWYRGDQLWPDPHLSHAMQLMRYVYNNRKEAAIKGERAATEMREKFSREKIASVMVSEINRLMTERGL